MCRYVSSCKNKRANVNQSVCTVVVCIYIIISELDMNMQIRKLTPVHRVLTSIPLTQLSVNEEIVMDNWIIHSSKITNCNNTINPECKNIGEFHNNRILCCAIVPDKSTAQEFYYHGIFTLCWHSLFFFLFFFEKAHLSQINKMLLVKCSLVNTMLAPKDPSSFILEGGVISKFRIISQGQFHFGKTLCLSGGSRGRRRRAPP